MPGSLSQKRRKLKKKKNRKLENMPYLSLNSDNSDNSNEEGSLMKKEELNESALKSVSVASEDEHLEDGESIEKSLEIQMSSLNLEVKPKPMLIDEEYGGLNLNVEPSKFDKKREKELYKQALEIEKVKQDTYSKRLWGAFGYATEVKEPSPESVAKAKEKIDDQYLQQATLSRLAQQKAELAALEERPVLSRLAKAHKLDNIESVIGGSHVLTPAILQKQQHERAKEVSHVSTC